MIVVDVAVAPGPDEIANIQVALLREHVGQQGVTGDVEGHAQKDIGAALVELATQFASGAWCGGRGHVKLKEGVAGHQGHAGQVGHIPGAHDDAA